MMSYYKVKYNIDTFQTPHCRYYHAANKDTALSMFEEALNYELVGYNTEVLDVTVVREEKNKIVECTDNNCCNNNGQ